ncbi:MAG: META domain-containing protein [Cyanobacteriota bacterium]
MGNQFRDQSAQESPKFNNKTGSRFKRAQGLAVLALGLASVGMAQPGIAQVSGGDVEVDRAANRPQLAQARPLSGSWRLVSMAGIEPGVPSQDMRLTAEFVGDRLSGFGGCNQFTGRYQATGRQLSVSPLASTQRACEGFLMDQEFRYLTALQGAQRYEIDAQGTLIVFYQNERESGELRFVPVAVRGLW